MLTASEKAWLEQRNEHPEHRFCRWCPHNEVRGREEEEGIWCSCNAEDVEGLWECVTEHYYFDRLWEALEFSERVAKRLAEYAGEVAGYEPCCELCPDKTCRITDSKNCSINLLKAARLAVEEEMDNG